MYKYIPIYLTLPIFVEKYSKFYGITFTIQFKVLAKEMW